LAFFLQKIFYLGHIATNHMQLLDEVLLLNNL
jgi:hypothetical protein